MKKNLFSFYTAPRIEVVALTENSVLCGSGDGMSTANEAFIEEETYNW